MGAYEDIIGNNPKNIAFRKLVDLLVGTLNDAAESSDFQDLRPEKRQSIISHIGFCLGTNFVEAIDFDELQIEFAGTKVEEGGEHYMGIREAIQDRLEGAEWPDVVHFVSDEEKALLDREKQQEGT